MVSHPTTTPSPLCSFLNLFCTSFITLSLYAFFRFRNGDFYWTSLVLLTNPIVHVWYVYPNKRTSDQLLTTYLLIRIIFLQIFCPECSVFLWKRMIHVFTVSSYPKPEESGTYSSHVIFWRSPSTLSLRLLFGLRISHIEDPKTKNSVYISHVVRNVLLTVCIAVSSNWSP